MYRDWVYPLVLSICLVTPGCGGGGSDSVSSSPVGSVPPVDPPSDPPNDAPAITFALAIDSGLSREYSADNDSIAVRYFSGGVAAADVDQNGFVDLYVVGGNDVPNHFYLNDETGFTEVGADVGLGRTHWGSGPAFGDIDGDGDLDLFIGAIEDEPVALYENRDGQFVDITNAAGLILSASATMSGTFYDYDRDGHLDLFLSHWGTDYVAGNDTETVWRNNGNMTFSNASFETGIANNLVESDTDHTFTPNFADIDNDGDGDLLMASDFVESQVYRNNDDGTFTKITDRDVIIDQSGMGAAVGDYDNDGDMDWFVTSIHNLEDEFGNQFGNRYYRNDGNGVFVDATDEMGVANGGWGWGACAADFDNDTRLDIFHVNGWVDGSLGDFTADRVRFYHQTTEGRFEEQGALVGLDDTGQGRGVVCFDVERDGDVDILIQNNSEDHLLLYLNETISDNHYLSIRVTGDGNNTFAIGAHVSVLLSNGVRQMREVGGSNNYVSHNPFEVHFGLGTETQAEVTISWPEGTALTQTFQANQQVTVMHPNRQ